MIDVKQVLTTKNKMRHASRIMINAQKKWPLGLSSADEPAFFRVITVIFIILVFCDTPVTRAVAALPEIVRALFRIITRAGNSDWILIPTLLVAIIGFGLGRFIFSNERKTKTLTIASISFFAFAGVALPGIAANLIKRLVGRARPVNFEEFGPLHFEPIFNDWSFQSFPSGDTTTIFALAAVIMFFVPRAKWWALAGAALVGLSRIMVGVHFPTDVFGGILVGTFGAHMVRNFCASRGWLFNRTGEGKYVPVLNWPDTEEPD